MTEAEKELMQRYDIRVEQKSVYSYKGFRYDRLEDALNYARIEIGTQHARNAPLA